MHRHAPLRGGWIWVGAIALVFAIGACADDSTAMTTTSATEATTTATDTTQTPPVTTVSPTTETPTTTDPVTTTDSTTTTTTVPTTTDPTDSTTTTTSTTDTTDTDTTADTTDTTDTTGGDEVIGRSVTQTVNSGTVATSPNFRMVFTMGQPTQNQGIYTSNNFRLQGGLIGANGNPP